MIKAFWFAIKVGLLVALAVWIVDRNGSMQFGWVDAEGHDYVVTMELGFFLLCILGLVLLAIFVYQTMKTFIDLPKSYRRYSEVRAKELGYEALTRGLTAVAAGDAKIAKKEAKKAGSLLPDDGGLPLLLEAQAARLEGREEDAVKSFVALLEHKDAGFLGVRGLLQSALDNDDDEGALVLAERALELHPKQPWILKINYDLLIKQRKWYRAEKVLTRLEKQKAIDAEQAQSDRVALLLAQAEDDVAEGYVADATQEVKRVLKLSPGFAPATILMSNIQKEQSNLKAAYKTVKKAWKSETSGALVTYWMEMIPEDEAGDKLKRLRWMEKLLKYNPHSPTGLRVAAELATEAGLWGEAREYFKLAEEEGVSSALYKSWAQLEEKSGGGEIAARHWLSKAADAPAAKGWICQQTGRRYTHWVPVAEPHGSFNTIEWTRPKAELDPMIMIEKKLKMNEAVLEAPSRPKDTSAA
jgi:HemY protein